MMKKIIFVVFIAFGGSFIGYSLVYAHIIPGVDRPFDPAAYYSDTAISYADSPSVFFYRDLASGGGTVIDKMRKMKSVLFSGDFTNLAGIFTSKTERDVSNTSPFSSSVLQETSNNISAVHDTTADIANSGRILEIREGSLFRRPDQYDEENNLYSEKEQRIWLNKAYLNIVEAAKSSIDDLDAQETYLNGIMANTYSAVGDLQAVQASAEMNAFNEAVNARRANLLGNYASLKATKNMEKEDVELQAIRITDKVSVQVSDPYSLKENDSNIYIKSTAPGFKNF